MGKWVKYYRLAHHMSVFEAKRAEGGEIYGIDGLRRAKKGQWFCRNPSNGHCWVCSDEAFDELYCEMSKPRPVKKVKKQEDGYKKGQSREMSSSYNVSSGLFGEDFNEKSK